MNNTSKKRPCWPLIWLWVLSISQYAYRYILQVNDAGTTHFYKTTPASLSALKYEILLFFAAYAISRFWRAPIRLDQQQRTLLWCTVTGILLVASILVMRSILMPGDFDETALCVLQLLPWMCSVFLVPLVINSDHSVDETLRVFERLTFWIAFPFWLVTVVLAAFDVQYPALSYPGVIVRFGGVLDDPNGYACLCLFLGLLSASYRSGFWRTRVVAYAAMVTAALSLTGYMTATTVGLCLFSFGLWRSRMRLCWKVAGAASVCLVGLAIVLLIPRIYDVAEELDTLASFSSAKNKSAEAHLSNLAPPESMLNEPAMVELLAGAGGFSENFYWRLLANFGVVGLLGIVSLSLLWPVYAFRRVQKPSGAPAALVIGLLFGSNGIAYLLTFPISLLYWSILAAMVFADVRCKQSSFLSSPKPTLGRNLIKASN